MLLELGHQTEHTHDLGDPGAGDPLPPGYLGLVCAVYASPLIQTLAVSIPPPRPPSRDNRCQRFDPRRRPLLRRCRRLGRVLLERRTVLTPVPTNTSGTRTILHAITTSRPAPDQQGPVHWRRDRLRPIGRTVLFRDVTATTSRPFRRPSP